MTRVIRCGSLILPDGIEHDARLIIDDGRIVDVASADRPGESETAWDASDYIVAPGFIDIHVHGALQADTMDADAHALTNMARFFARHGVTGFLPTTVTAPASDITAAIEAIKRASFNQAHAEATILGAHIEGPFINPKRCGAQPTAFMRPADPTEYLPWFNSGVVKLITVAPEMPGVMDLIAHATQHDVVVAIGHTDASYEQAQAAFMAGANQCTHAYNAMSPLHHRAPGALGAVMANPSVFAQLIADNVHVHPGAVAALYQSKGASKLAVITDAIEATGAGDGEFKLGPETVTVRGGIARLANGALAGSTLTMDVAFRNIMAATGCSLVEASRMCSHTPACAIGLGQHKGLIAPGYDADLVFLDQGYSVVRTVTSARDLRQAM